MSGFIQFWPVLPRVTASLAALDLQAPEVPEFAMEFMPKDPGNFRDGLMELLRDALLSLRPDLKEGMGVCLGVIALVMMVSMLQSFPGSRIHVLELSGAVAVGILLLDSSNSMIHMARQVITEMNEYGKLLLPVMATALAAQGGVSSSAALYAGTMLFNSLLTGLIIRWLIPMLYLFLALALSLAATGEALLANLVESIKRIMTWILRTILYIFTGYMGITGVISGTTDAAALKAAKLTISSVVPVVGGILSDASDVRLRIYMNVNITKLIVITFAAVLLASCSFF